MAKEIRTLRGAPKHVQEWWRGTGLSACICRLVENGATWEEAHSRLKACYTKWWDRGRRGNGPLLRFSNRVHRSRILARIDAGEPFSTNPRTGEVAVNGSSYVKPRRT